MFTANKGVVTHHYGAPLDVLNVEDIVPSELGEGHGSSADDCFSH